VHDRELRDNPPAGPEDGETPRRLGQYPKYNLNQPEVHDVYRSWRSLADGYEEQRLLLGETYVVNLDRLATFYGRDDGLHLAMNFAFIHAELEELPGVVDETLATLPGGSWPVWVASSHDHVRFPTRWADGDDALARGALVALLTLPGTPILYYGDELLLPQVEVPFEELRDPVGKIFWPENRGRDGSRTPMPWEPVEGYGFTAPGVRPWLRFGDRDGRTVAEQRDDPRSALSLTRELLALRRGQPDLRAAAYERVDSPEGVWAYRRGEGTLVAINLSGRAAELPGSGRIELSTRRDRTDEPVESRLRLALKEAVVVADVS
jgi:alpha-glucosidase